MNGLFLVKFGTVDPDKGNLREVFEFGLELLQFREHVDTIDAATCPEVYHEELTLELIAEGQWLLVKCVEPLQVA